MGYDASVYKVLIASPSDVKEEREAISQAIYEWNVVNSEQERRVLLPVRWETHSTPEFSGGNPQEILNRQLVRGCDVLVGAFWTKVGSPTERYDSGTLEEIEEFIKDRKPILLYFSKRDLPRDVNLEQVQKLRIFKEKYQGLGIYKEYENALHLIGLLKDDLVRVIRSIMIDPIRTEDRGALVVLTPKEEQSTEDRYKEIKEKLVILFRENERVFLEYGPYSVRAQQFISDSASIWEKKCREVIIPNNQRIVDLLRENIDLVPKSKLHIFDAFINHVEGFKDNHLSEYKDRNAATFPKEITNILNP
ncbi:hypothetical protein [Paenibacillus sp. N3.4]|uniref:hypothetical protein n=1 Tax=Paenibacillus sp. N3.4 TaxID=2603222 RepID=UPI0011C6F9B2|nr:hypothetical protein [Paenibacillus sp. N3.4]TXK77741.1 hypothetical protein FU659_21930 [Paenibacillus sp. N3.4]